MARCWLLITLVCASAPPLWAQAIELQKGDRISIIGNTLADRMQHDGWLDTYLHTRFPNHDFTIRHLGFSGDELTIRLRSSNFGTPDEWLTKTQTDVVFAFFGYNESFGGEEGLDKFKKDLENFIKQTTAQKYNGKTNARLVLFSPIAHEALKDKNLPDPTTNNARLALYTKTMADIAQANKIPFVDLFNSTQKLYATAKQPWTMNGIHLTNYGNEQLAKLIDTTCFNGDVKRESERLATVQRAVQDKNFHWFQRYRTTDGYSIYGGRAGLKFVGGQTNFVVAQREMEVLDVMTANRDKRVWSVAKGNPYQAVDDSNTPAFIPVTTNKPGNGPEGKHIFLDGPASLEKMKLAQGLAINVFATEKDFPELVNPVQMAWDTKGRLWVAVWPTYPHWKPKEPMNDKLLIFEDTNGDGKADKMTVFADNLHNPTGFEFYNGGVIVANAPDVLFLKDTNGDDKADSRTTLIHGIDSADTHHTANSFTLDPGGALYFQEGTFHHTQVETPYGPSVRCANAGVFRYEPRTQKFDVYVTYGFANPHGHVFDTWGQDIIVDGTGAVPYHGALFSGHLNFPDKHKQPPTVYKQRTRPCPGMEYLSSSHFPDSMNGNLLVANVIGFQGILQYKISDKDSSIAGTELEPIVSSTDPNFRPTDIKVGPDGAIYFVDWHNPIIGHMQHNLRDPSRDREHGRIYRITYKDRPLLKPAKIAGEPIDALLELLKSREDRVRYAAKIELGSRDSAAVSAAVTKWVDGLQASDTNHEHHLTEAMWVLQHHNIIDMKLINRVLSAKDFHARAAAARVLCYQRDRVPNALEIFKGLAADPSGAVRLQAVRAASFFKEPEAIEILLVADGSATDEYLTYVRGETMRALEPVVKKAIASNTPIKFTTTAGSRYFAKIVPTEDLLKLKRTPEVYSEMLIRKGIRDEYRREALTALAQQLRHPTVMVLLRAIRQQDAESQIDESVAFDLLRLLVERTPAELREQHGDIEKLATDAKTPLLRQLGYAALVSLDNNVEPAWKLASKNVGSLKDFVTATPLIRDINLHAALYPKLLPLLDGVPKELAATLPKSNEAVGRYVRIELPGKQRTLTLAEVEVFSDGRNVARRGKATQSSTAHNGAAGRGIDGNKSPTYGDGGQTHSKEGEDNPWWEVDLGKDFPIEAIDVYNRADGALGTRLNNFTVKILDSQRKVVFEKPKLPTPTPFVHVVTGAESPERVLRRAAMVGLTSLRGKETATFSAIAKYVRNDAERHAAILALARMPAADWPKDEAKELLATIIAYVNKLPVAERTSDEALDSLQFAETLTNLLPPAEAKASRTTLREIGVRVLRVGTLTDQMLFDKDRLIVQAGKPVEIIFENTDIMPHNFAIVQPGALEEVGNLAETSATQPGALERHYIPKSNKILLGSNLLQPRESQRLSYVAPKEPGIYPYVCTYPGHWRRMYGAMYVVADLEAYLADPEGYLASVKLPLKDELLKFNRPRKEWKFEELAPEVEKMKDGRSFATAKKIFTVASCVACHKFGGVGVDVGPDLTKLDPKVDKPLEILRHLLEPSLKIDEKYQVWTFNLQSGKKVTGMILEQKEGKYKVIENPLAKAEAITLADGDIDTKVKTTTSIMPKGLLDKLTKEEILDLIAYILAKGDANHLLFKGGHDHHH